MHETRKGAVMAPVRPQRLPGLGGSNDGCTNTRKGAVMKARFIVLALVAAAAVGMSWAAATSSAHVQPADPPDTYVAAWDAVGTQAFSAAALTPAEGHVIFAYVAIAVY